MCCTSWHDEIFRENQKNTTTLLEEFFQISKHVGNGFVRRESRISDGKSEVKVGRSSTREPRWKWKQTHSVLIWMLLGYGHSIPAPTSVLRNPGLFSTRNRWTLQVSWDCGIRAAIIFEMFLLSRLKNLYFSVSSYRLMTIGWYSGQVFYSKYEDTSPTCLEVHGATYLQLHCYRCDCCNLQNLPHLLDPTSNFSLFWCECFQISKMLQKARVIPKAHKNRTQMPANHVVASE